MSWSFKSAAELLELCATSRLHIFDVMQERETEFSADSRQRIRREMALSLSVMRSSIEKGLEDENRRSVSGLTGGDAIRMQNYAARSLMGEDMSHIIAASMAVVEVNSSMGRIVAAPTAGASGILPGVLITLAEKRGWTEDDLINGLFTAGAVGVLIAGNATISGAEGGCQAETGSAAAMTAAALVELSGGSPEMALNAAAIALKNVLGLVCDPVAGLVECPCIKRNALGAANAVLSADLALAKITSLIPLDEVIAAMYNVGRVMSPNLRETGKGGLAATPTARALKKNLRLGSSEE